ncbi:PucR family transcriptional regulator [Nocardioides guangzhouensis]|uniref:PucR family transcriptional regulator n=1 Tax=Nocardioides guangzhouensis TaxID=2497878 RepID=A0A4Q4ZJF5_9ACTN|nr:PucR family transcriptional regulator ligand-binding domain-containing protein [Nocardioides guangzhouensis]RYP88088.1 PucR family transcriptional regulator [Nocardioides guangzhouensis]
MAVLSVEQVLAMPVLRAAAPRVLAGRASLHRAVHWVHSAELADIAPLLREGDLLLSTGIAMPGTAPELAELAAGLAETRAAGLVIELGRRWDDVPASLVEACEQHGLPLVALAREVRFAAVAQAVGERIVDEQLAELREAQRVHDTFTELSISEAGPREVLEAVQRLSGAAVVLESEQHQVLDYRAGPDDVAEFLAGWAARSRAVEPGGRTTWDPTNGWLVTRVGKRDRGWGRLVVQMPAPPSEPQIAMAERAAAALALHRLHDRQRDSVVRRTHHELLLGLLADPTSPDLHQRCELAGLPLDRRQLVGVTLRPLVTDGARVGASDARTEEVIAAAVHAVHELRVPALVCEMDRDVRVLLSLAPSGNARRTVDDLAARVRRRQPVLVGAGRPVERQGEADRTLREAHHVLQSLRPSASAQVVHRLEDVHLRGLLAMLADDDRLRMYVERELEPLRTQDGGGNGGLLDAVRALVTHPTSKSEAAASLHVSRPVFYDRIAKAERLLGVNLDDPDIRVSVHVALVADEIARQTGQTT